MKPIDQYSKGQIIEMIVPDKPIDISPCYVSGMIRNFKRDPVAEIKRVDRERNRICVIDYSGCSWTIIPDWIKQETILFL